jgi:hypothetical protein
MVNKLDITTCAAERLQNTIDWATRIEDSLKDLEVQEGTVGEAIVDVKMLTSAREVLYKFAGEADRTAYLEFVKNLHVLDQKINSIRDRLDRYVSSHDEHYEYPHEKFLTQADQLFVEICKFHDSASSKQIQQLLKKHWKSSERL